MTTPLDVLLISEEDGTAEPWLEELRKSGYSVRILRARDATTVAEWMEKPWEVALALEPLASAIVPLLAEIAHRRIVVVAGDHFSTEDELTYLEAGASDVLTPKSRGRIGPVIRRELDERVDTVDVREIRLRRAHDALLLLAKVRAFQGDHLEDDLRLIAEVAAHALHVRRASVWLYDREHTRIRCVELFDMESGEHTKGAELFYKEHKAYFDALEKDRLIAAHDAHTDPATMEFSAGYLKPLGITSMLDAAARLRGELVGVLCLEHVGRARRWSEGEMVFACALADLVSLALESAERESAESALRNSEQRFREIFMNSSDAIVLLGVTADGRFVCEGINPACERATGLRNEMILGKTPEQALPAAVAQVLLSRYRGCLESGRPVTYEHQLPLPAGLRWFNTTLFPMRDEEGRIHRLAAIARDITDRVRMQDERERLQRRLANAQKMEALGTLAGGVAHDFNNLLAGILGNADLLRRDLEHRPESRERLDQIVEITLRSRDLVRQVLTFSRSEKPKREPIRLSPVIAAVVKYVRVTAAPGIRVSAQVAEDEPLVMADATQMHQVFVNLATNAAQAMAETGGDLEIGLRRVTVAPEEAQDGSGLQPGEYVSLRVKDTGAGMDAETLEHIFEPFFTTKTSGQGTGLGLAVVHGIVQEHDGVIRVVSRPGEGTTFEVLLPATHLPPAITPIPAMLQALGAGERILVIDDQSFLVDVAGAMLRRLGYRPELFTDPRRALAAFRSAPDSFQLVMTDYSMPAMTGLELAGAIRDARRDVPIVLMSGFDATLDESRAALQGVREVLRKPFTPDQVGVLLHKILNAQAPETGALAP
ncbi:MAG: PAS domain-containing protein [Planctomycetes bacterium]|nr:PAS domain-containing protein [Planctomycetota bacterium]